MLALIRVRGTSMSPTLNDGDLLLSMTARSSTAPKRRLTRSLAPGRIVVLRLPGDRPLSVKRLTFRQDDGWWVERDNPAAGVDSWQVGAIAEPDIVAVAVVRLWPSPTRL